MRKKFQPYNITAQSFEHKIPQDELMLACQQIFTRQLCQKLNKKQPSTVRAKLPIQVIVAVTLFSVVSKARSFSAVFATLYRSGFWFIKSIQVTKSSFYERLSCFSSEIILWLLNHLTPTLRQSTQKFANSHPIFKWVRFTSRVFSIDDTVLEQIKRVYFLDNKKRKTVLPGRLTAIFDLCTGMFHHVSFCQNPRENELHHARENLESLPSGSLILCDLGFFSFSFFDWLTQHFTYFVSRMKANTSVEVIEEYVNNNKVRDRLVWLGVYRSNQAAYPVRYVELFIDGEWWGYITNMLDPKQFPAHHVYATYKQRWEIERCFSVLKVTLGMRNLFLSSINGIKWQIWSTFLAYQLIQTVRCKLAGKLKVQPDCISWTNFFTAHESYYREAVGRTKKSFLNWVVAHRNNLNIVLNRKRSQRKNPDFAKGFDAFYDEVTFHPESWPEPRKPRYSSQVGLEGNKPPCRKVEIRKVKMVVKKGKRNRKVRSFP